MMRRKGLRIIASCDPPFNVVFADIGGNRKLEHVLELPLDRLRAVSMRSGCGSWLRTWPT